VAVSLQLVPGEPRLALQVGHEPGEQRVAAALPLLRIADRGNAAQSRHEHRSLPAVACPGAAAAASARRGACYDPAMPPRDPVPSRTLVAPEMRIGPRTFAWGARTYVMGVINVSPDSFSGDGITDPGEAAAQAARFLREGADILDVGGQSTRPGPAPTDAGFDEITPEEELRRVLPVIERLRRELPDAPISIDTYKPAVARAALEAGAHLLNDIWGFRRAPELAQIAAAAGVPAVVMHNQRGRGGDDVICAIADGLRESMRIAEVAGLPASRLIADPGFGFGWRPEQNIEMLRRLRDLAPLGLPLLV